MPLQDVARAKVNLSLSVPGKRSDGYHELESLVAFAGDGDVLTLEQNPSGQFAFEVVGPFGTVLRQEQQQDNLVVRALKALSVLSGRPLDFSVTLDKKLPVASGIGGGSADAAAALRLALRYWGCSVPERDLMELCRTLGADVPVCYHSQACWMRGIGETLDVLEDFPACPVLLVNPGDAVSTAAVFRALNAPALDEGFLPARRPGKLSGAQELVDLLGTLSNDLQEPAVSQAPLIRDVLGALEQQKGSLFSAMSGSGATCFCLFASMQEARQAGEILSSLHGWWTLPTELS
ncbi:4-(cytidine 5'-diphospho)-2-C-methyl-D-erythritol kinase [Kiloniella sp. b19]|uniref:4-(cytidine 5'-diphospho)-2-C-methyl-D-erythritol kinase n=1 Tax=Kiloniella sp. GXU_MW_B19 TaxID=3141326 RepID=UPI0031D9B16E